MDIILERVSQGRLLVYVIIYALIAIFGTILTWKMMHYAENIDLEKKNK